MKKILLIVLRVFGFSTWLMAQDAWRFGSVPALLITGKFEERLTYSLATSSEIEFPSGAVRARPLNLNFEPALSFDANPNLNLVAALQYRLREPFTGGGVEIRPWQQVTLIHRLGKYRLRNRFRAEQRWVHFPESNAADFDLRLRYRLSTDFPLQGERLDVGELYLNISSEALLTPTQQRALFFWEHRAYLGLGWQQDRGRRLEPALELRTRRTGEPGIRQHFLFFRLIGIFPISQKS